MNVQHGSIEKKRKEKGILELSFGRATAGWPSRQLRETAIPALFRCSLRTFRCMLSFRLQQPALITIHDTPVRSAARFSQGTGKIRMGIASGRLPRPAFRVKCEPLSQPFHSISGRAPQMGLAPHKNGTMFRDQYYRVQDESPAHGTVACRPCHRHNSRPSKNAIFK
jgi:hypothetical protein